ncbi:MAG: efflux RND transporter periplasmic adaptor subunit [Bacillota bacterium]
MRKKMLIILIIVLAIGSLGGLAFYQSLQKAGIPVQTIQVVEEPLQVKVFATGRVRAEKEDQIYAPFSGIIKEVLVEVGDRVTKGQVLARFDMKELERQLREARARLQLEEANLLQAKAGAREEDLSKARARLDQSRAALEHALLQLERITGLAEAGAVSAEERERAQLEVKNQQLAVSIAENDLKLLEKGERPEVIRALEAQKIQAELKLRELEEMLAQGEVRSTGDGLLLQKNVEAGQYVSQGTGLFLVGALERLLIEADVAEGDSGHLEKGQAVEITGSSFGGKTFQGEVIRVAPVAKLLTGNPVQTVIPVEIAVTANPAIKPGVTAEVKIITVDRPLALLVPYEAVFEDGEGREWVFVVKDGQAEKRPITTGAGNELYLEVLQGLEQGEQLVINPPDHLADGDRVRILPAQGEKSR